MKWTGERTESFLSDAHARDHVTHAELAMDADGNFTALKVHTIANMGAYLSTFASCIPTYLYGTLLSGQYKTPAIYCAVDAVYTNTTPVDAYRGAGRPEATYVLETLVETAARETGRDRAELRRKNFIPKDAFPYQTPVALQYDTGDFEALHDEALRLADYQNFAQRRAASEAKGKLRGIGFSCYIEACGIAPSAVVGSLGCGVGLWESAKVRFSHTGMVQVLTGTHTHGQGHETTFAQLIAEKLGVPIENVEVIHGDTEKTPVGMGTYGSRSMAVGGPAIVNACDKIIEKGKKIAAHLLEAAEGDIEFKDGSFTVKGTDRAKSIGEVVFEAYVPHHLPYGLIEPGMEETAFYDPANFTYPAGCHVCEVEVDPDTGIVKIDRFVAVDDFGKVINPMIVEGQVHGGLVQGIGQALTEGCVYDDNGPAALRLVHGLLHAQGGRRAELRGGDDGDALHPQHARRQGLRRGRRDRVAAGGHERRSPTRSACASRCRRPRRRCGGRCRAGRCPRRRNREAKLMYAFEYHRPSDRGRGRLAAPGRVRRPAPGRRPHADPDAQAAPGVALGPDRSRRDRASSRGSSSTGAASW